ncbi:amino acid ABC transporter permease, partial [Streptomyces sp. NPDC096068]
MTDKINKDPAAAPAGSDPAGSSPYEAIKAVPVRHYGRWVSAVVVVALLG